jgi:hypothetical protein
MRLLGVGFEPNIKAQVFFSDGKNQITGREHPIKIKRLGRLSSPV